MDCCPKSQNAWLWWTQIACFVLLIASAPAAQASFLGDRVGILNVYGFVPVIFDGAQVIVSEDLEVTPGSSKIFLRAGEFIDIGAS